MCGYIILNHQYFLCSIIFNLFDNLFKTKKSVFLYFQEGGEACTKIHIDGKIIN